jgi:hypothetical protein
VVANYNDHELHRPITNLTAYRKGIYCAGITTSPSKLNAYLPAAKN